MDVAKGTLPFLRASTLGDLLLLLGHGCLLLNVASLVFRLAYARYRVFAADMTVPLQPAGVQS